MSARSMTCLERCLPALDDRTSSPLRVLGHNSTPLYEVFEVEETVNRDGEEGARRFIVSVRADRSHAVFVPLAPLRAAA